MRHFSAHICNWLVRTVEDFKCQRNAFTEAAASVAVQCGCRVPCDCSLMQSAFQALRSLLSCDSFACDFSVVAFRGVYLCRAQDLVLSLSWVPLLSEILLSVSLSRLHLLLGNSQSLPHFTFLLMFSHLYRESLYTLFRGCHRRLKSVAALRFQSSVSVKDTMIQHMSYFSFSLIF